MEFNFINLFFCELLRNTLMFVAFIYFYIILSLHKSARIHIYDYV
jgi:hypothetical protein